MFRKKLNRKMNSKENWEIEVQRKGEFTFRYNLGIDDDITIMISSKNYTETAAYITLRELVKLLEKHDRNYAQSLIS